VVTAIVASSGFLPAAKAFIPCVSMMKTFGMGSPAAIFISSTTFISCWCSLPSASLASWIERTIEDPLK
jgi:hypothetical protein